MKMVLIAIIFSLFTQISFAQEVYQDFRGTLRAKVVEIVLEEQRNVPGTDTVTQFQTIKAEILEGEKRGDIVIVENDYLKLEKGDSFFLNYLVTIDGDELYSVSEPDRRNGLYILIGLFVASVLIFGGWQGLRSLLSLFGSLFIIVYLLLPNILKGYSPLVIAIGLSIVIVALTMYLTHGFNRRTHSAFLGTVISILITGLLATYAVSMTHLSGFSSDEVIYLNLDTKGMLDFSKLLLGAIIIGALGVLDDITITQATVVEEIKNTDVNLSRTEVYKKALRVGREHVGALVNTLALAYAGASLPLLLLFYNSPEATSMILNREIFAVEVVRTIVGSIGLILAVPLTTAISTFALVSSRE